LVRNYDGLKMLCCRLCPYFEPQSDALPRHVLSREAHWTGSK